MPIKRALVSARQKLTQQSEVDDNNSVSDERKTDLSMLGIRTLKKFFDDQIEFTERKQNNLKAALEAR